MVGISGRLYLEKISIWSLARPQGIDVMPANGHGRPAKRQAHEDLWVQRLCDGGHKLCPWFRSRVQAFKRSDKFALKWPRL